MAKQLSEKDKAFRALVVALDGRIDAIAAHEGVSRAAISARLARIKHRSWWVSYKKRRKVLRARERARRWRENKARIAARALGLIPWDA